MLARDNDQNLSAQGSTAKRSAYICAWPARSNLALKIAVAYVLDGNDLRRLPLIERKRRRYQLIQKSGCERIIYAQHIEANS
jgi:hypothetical protein